MARQKVRLKRTTLIAVFCVIFLCSVGFMRLGLLGRLSHVWPIFILINLVIFLRFSRVLCFVILISCLLGVWRGSIYLNQLHKYQSEYGRYVTIEVSANEDGYYGKNSQLSFTASHVVLKGQLVRGKVQVSGFGLNAIYQGDELRVTGKLRPGYGASQASISYAKLDLVSRHISFVASLRQRFTSGMISALPEPLASFAMGLLIGQRASLPDDVKQDLRVVGLTHIIAVSGYNLTIMLRASQRLFANHSKRISLVIAITFIIFFLAITGASASIVRASIVSSLSLLAASNGRHFKPLNLILIAGAITAYANPFYVWNDISWYLSFLAFAGVMILAPQLVKKLSPHREPGMIAMIAIETVCAELMTLPLILHYFGQMTLVGLPSNLLVVSLVPLAMLLSLIAGLSGMIAPQVCGWLSWPATILLNFMLDIAHIIAGLPHVFVESIGFSTLQMVGTYAGIIFMLALLVHKTKISISGKITDKIPSLTRSLA